MIIGVPKEIKAQENRVGAVPAMVLDLVGAGHTVLVQNTAGLGAGVTDEAYVKVGAKMVASAAEVYGQADMIVKVKEPLPAEYPLIKKGQLLFTYFHFAAARELTDAMLKSGANCFAYETLIHRGSLPLLTPMSEVAGRMSVQVGAVCLEKHYGGRGILLGGVPGVEPANVVILGGGVVGLHVSMQPPWSTATSTMTEPSFIVFRSSRRISRGARAPCTSTAPMTRSACRICSRIVIGELCSSVTLAGITSLR